MQFSGDVFKKRIVSHLSGPSVVTKKPDHPQQARTQQELGDLLGIKDDREFLESAYQRILGRPCDISGLVSYLEALSNHVPRRIVLQTLLDSEEAKGRPAISRGEETTKRGFLEENSRTHHADGPRHTQESNSRQIRFD